MNTSKLVVLAVVLPCLWSCQAEEPTPAENVLHQSAEVVHRVDDGLRVLHQEAEVEVPFTQIVEGLDGEAAAGLPPGSPAIGGGGVGSPEIGSGGPGATEIPSGGGGGPAIPQGGIGTPAGGISFTGAVCDFIDAICQKVIACAPPEFQGDIAACAEISAQCVPTFQKFTAEIGPVPPVVISYLQCITNGIRASGCSLFTNPEAISNHVQACLPAGVVVEPEEPSPMP